MTAGGHWSDRYIGLPYADSDCAELCARVQREQFGRTVELPSERAAGLRDQSCQIEKEAARYLQRTDSPVEGDVVLMRCRGRLRHTGTYCLIRGEPHVLHAMRNAGQSVRHRLRDLPRFGLVAEEFYSWTV